MPDIGKTIILCGGDRREEALYRCWKSKGAAVKAAGFEQIPEMEQAETGDFREAAALIAPLPGIRADGSIRALFAKERLLIDDCLEETRPGVILLTGTAAAPLRERLAQRTTLLLTGDDEELALLNAIPTAEGAVQKALELSPVTLHGSSTLIFGLGRCGRALARALRGLGARVTAVVRRSENAALAYSMGLTAIEPDAAAAAAKEADFIFTTVPAPLLNAGFLKRVRAGAVILDLAAAPGGTDFTAAAGLGLKAVLLPGLPGLVAPQTSGLILERVYRRLLREAGGPEII